MQHLNTNYGRKDFLEHVSPDFKVFIDTNLINKSFVIRDMFSEEILHEIPNYLMKFKDDPEECILKF